MIKEIIEYIGDKIEDFEYLMNKEKIEKELKESLESGPSDLVI